MAIRSRNWCFTLNNYDAADELALSTEVCEYLIYGKETAPQTGTKHLQGYIEYKNAKLMSTIKKTYPKMHLEKRRGSAKQAADYCRKGGDVTERGKMSEQGKRTDLERVVEMVEDKKTMAEIAEEEPVTFIKYNRGIAALKGALTKHRSRDDPPNVIWLHGKTGTGKTRFPHDNHDSLYIKDGTQWWDGYEQQEAIVIDDFDGKWPFRDLLRLLDRYEYQGQTKGGYTKINSPWIYITCSYPPETFWNGDDLAQMQRRIKHTILFQ